MKREVLYTNLRSFLDVIVPTLEGTPPEPDVKTLGLGSNFPALKRALEVMQSAFRAEEERRSVIQSKATTILGSTSIALSLLGLRSDLGQSTRGLPTWVIVVAGSFLVCTIAYFVVAILCAAKVLLVSGHGVVSIEKMSPGPIESEDQYLARLAREYSVVSQVNSYFNDRRTDYLILAQRYFRNGLVLLLTLVAVFSLAIPLVTRSLVDETTSKPSSPEIINLENRVHIIETTVSGLQIGLSHLKAKDHIAVEDRTHSPSRPVSRLP